ncbi:MAG TPA: 7TM diverse intracellular signaling domain-containing protein, partial [Polyangiales bacterium]|nr:7TM diverse intracellular signaling domain-containing protein [Polyangiales bacterium]
SATFLEHQGRELLMLGMFYGLILVMAAYNLFIFISARDRAYLYYVLYDLSLGLAQFTFSGHSFEHIVPDHPSLANRLPALMVSLIFVWALLFVRSFLNLRETLPRYARLVDVATAAAASLALFSLFGPYSFKLAVIAALPFSAIAAGPLVVLLRRKYRPAQFFATGWVTLLIGALLYIFKTLGFLPTMLVTEWGVQIGAALEVVLLSLALADRINTMRGDLAGLNQQLSRNVVELQLALGRAEEATRAKSEFLATMSHELRTPLNAIINVPQGLSDDFPAVDTAACSACGALFELEPTDVPVSAESSCPACGAAGALRQERVTRYLGSPDHTKYHLGLIERAGCHLLQMVDGILDFSKIDAGALKLRRRTVEPATLVREALETVAELATRSHVRLESVIEPALEAATLHGDPLRIKQVLINLLGNAIKFSSAETSVTVAVKRVDTNFLFSVQDHGIGIAPEHRQRIFERFEQIDKGDTRKYGGTGLGLSISRSLVELHGGEIWVESELGVGSTFYFRLPEAGSQRELGVESARLRAPLTSDQHPAEPRKIAS